MSVREPFIQKPRKRRARTGCLNCRKKHKKCDETKPTCSSCMKKSELCEWPMNNGRFNKNSVSSLSRSIEHNDESKNLDKYADRLIKNFNKKSTSDDYVTSPTKNPHLSNSDSKCSSTLTNSSKPVLRVSSSTTNIPYNNYCPGTNMPLGLIGSNESMGLKAPLDQILNSSKLSPRDGRSTNDNMLAIEESNGNRLTILESPSNPSNPSNKMVNGNTENQQRVITAPFDNNINIENGVENGSVYFNSMQNNNFNNCDNGSSTTKADNNTTYSLSPQDSLAPFLLYNDLHNTFRDYMFTNAELNDFTTTANFNNILYSPAPNSLSRNSSKNLQDLLNSSIDNTNKESDVNTITLANRSNDKVSNIFNKFGTDLTPREELELFKNYLYEVAPWLDMFDSSKQFGTRVADLARNNKSLLYAIYAISSRQKEQTEPGYSSEKTIQLYQESLKHLIPTVNKVMDKSIISSCVILCVFEMMSSSPKEWRHHLEGCHALFEANDINGFSGDLERRLFWCYARMDVNSAVIGEQSTIIPSENWLPKGCSISDLKRLFNETNDDDMYANYIVFLCSRVLNLISNDSKNFQQEWESLWNEIIDWNLHRTFHLKPVFNHDDKPFPGVLFLNGPAISANQLFHMAIILLTQNKPRLYKIKPSTCIVCTIFSFFCDFTNLYRYQKSTIWHAKQICAISIHNTHQ